MYNFLDTASPNTGLGTPLRDGGNIINANFLKLHSWMQSRSNIATNSIPSLANGGPTYLLAVEFSSGNPMPLTVYGRTTTPTDTANPGWVQSVDGQWWKITVPGGVLYIEQFGGKADSDGNGTPGTDNRQPLIYANLFDAFETAAYIPHSLQVRFGAGHYSFADTLEFHRAVHPRGVGGGFETGGSTNWHFPANKTFIIFGSHVTTGETAHGTLNEGTSSGSTLENINMFGKTTSTDHDRAGIHMRTLVHLKHISLANVGGDGFRIRGSTAENTTADFITLEHCSVSSCSRNALDIRGNDANVCHISDFSTHGTAWADGTPIVGGIGGCGIYDTAQFGNKYDNIHVAGYGNHGVYHLGRAYFLISLFAGEGEATTPGTNRLVWYDIGALGAANAQFPQWSATPAVPHRPQLPILTGSGAGHVFDNPYIELSTCPCHIPGGAVAYGGTIAGTVYSNIVTGEVDGIASKRGWVARQSYTSAMPEYAYSAGATAISFGTTLGSDEPTKGPAIFWHYREKDTVQYSYRYYENDLVYSVNGVASGVTPIWWVTTALTTVTFGRDTPQSHKFVLADLALRDPGNSNNARLYGVRDAAPGAGYHAQGEFFFNVAPAAGGTLGWSCVGSGTPGTWKAIPVPA
jgi:hypothetical protein